MTRLRAFGGALVMFMVIAAAACSGTTPTPAAKSADASSGKPAASGSAAAAATPSEAPIEILGKFGLSPVHGPWGTTVTASASNLKGQTPYDIVWTTVTGKWVLSADQSEYKG